jgi:hypothetical protein
VAASTPVDPNSPTDAEMEAQDRFLRFAKAGQAEDEINKREIDEFIRTQR